MPRGQSADDDDGLLAGDGLPAKLSRASLAPAEDLKPAPLPVLAGRCRPRESSLIERDAAESRLVAQQAAVEIDPSGRRVDREKAQTAKVGIHRVGDPHREMISAGVPANIPVGRERTQPVAGGDPRQRLGCE